MKKKYQEKDINEFFEEFKSLPPSLHLHKVHQIINQPHAKATHRVKFQFHYLKTIIMTSVFMIALSALILWFSPFQNSENLKQEKLQEPTSLKKEDQISKLVNEQAESQNIIIDKIPFLVLEKEILEDLGFQFFKDSLSLEHPSHLMQYNIGKWNSEIGSSKTNTSFPPNPMPVLITDINGMEQNYFGFGAHQEFNDSLFDLLVPVKINLNDYISSKDEELIFWFYPTPDFLVSLQGLDTLNILVNLNALTSLEGLQGLENLESLAGLEGLAGLEVLASLEGLAGLEGLSGLEGLAGLSKLDSLQSLAGLAGLAKLESLSGLSGLSGLAGLNSLAGLAGLAEINQEQLLNAINDSAILSEEIENNKMDLIIEDLKVYPNPAKEKVNIEFRLSEDMDASISLVKISGKIVRTLSAEKKWTAGTHSIKADISNISSGIYVISFQSSHAKINKSLIIRH